MRPKRRRNAPNVCSNNRKVHVAAYIFTCYAQIVARAFLKSRKNTMKVYNSHEIKNIALLGNDGSGKTTLTEALLLNVVK